ncbi:23S rRNA (pseudouridine(1915)-N(3))-methyltransferase RlmH [candidate division KSB1 bacterium]|nr:23S rRNA (pseudouridine(1915)-N(3))-methyltransferase RlmH [candidate division KSB1 bacterium]
MMKITLIVVGKTKAAYLQDGIDDFMNRLKHYCRIDYIVVREEKITSSKTDEFIISEEVNRIRLRLHPSSWAVALDVNGTSINSVEFAEFLSKRMNAGQSDITFIIGGPLGLDASIRSLCKSRLSLSHLTLTHDMTRLLLLEQIYRAFTILNNEKYHK